MLLLNFGRWTTQFTVLLSLGITKFGGAKGPANTPITKGIFQNMVQHTTHDWPTIADLNAPSRSIARKDDLDTGEELDCDNHEEVMLGLISGELELSPETREVMGIVTDDRELSDDTREEMGLD